MTDQQAINIMSEVCTKFIGTYEQHVQIQQAFKVLVDKVQPKTKEEEPKNLDKKK